MSRENLLAALFVFVRFAVCCYRAAHQAVIIDEATTYNKFISGPWIKLFGRYDANNHLLSSVFIKATVACTWLSPLTLRLPTLLSGLALTLGVFALLKRVESPLFRWSAFALFCLHPPMFDFSIAARGYCLSLAFFVWALHFAWDRRYFVSGILLGLSIAANLSNIFPVLALLVVIIAFDRKAVLYLVLPAIAIGGGLNYPSLRRAQRNDFYIGYPDLKTAATSYVYTSLHSGQNGILGERDVSDRITLIGLPAFAILIAAASFRHRSRLLIPGLICGLTFVGLIAANRLFGVNYPADRACLYFVVLCPLAWAMAADNLPNRYLHALWMLPAIAIAAQFCTQLQMHYFEFWQEQADDQQIARIIEQTSSAKPANSLSLSTNWIHQPTFEFYRRCYHIAALTPVERLEPTPITGYDYYVLSWADFDLAKGSNHPTLFLDGNIPVILLGN